ncbi:MAG: urease accessory UreF family protein [Xenococcaceae cyanobacterium MO_167.B27]|nr:urease accessory UreF family protein [Xenococcaceae cyanobacterium MO_167.B27]
MNHSGLDNGNDGLSQKLALMQLADSFFPSGSFTLSHGLEFLVQTKQITSAADLQMFLQLLLRNKIGSCDLVALIHSYRGSQHNDLAAVKLADQRLFAQTLIAENRITQIKSGRALLMVANSTWQNEQLTTLTKDVANNRFNCLHPVVFAVVAQIAGISEEDAILGFLHSFVTSLLGAAIRLGVIGHVQSQKLLLNLASDIELTYHQAQLINLDQMWSCTPTIELAQMQHQKLDIRLFAS